MCPASSPRPCQKLVRRGEDWVECGRQCAGGQDCCGRCQEERERVRQKNQKYYQKHRETLLAQNQKYYQEHKEGVSAKNKRYYQKNKEEILTQRREYRQENREAILDYRRKWGHEVKTGLQKLAERDPTYKELEECWCKTKTAYCSEPGTTLTRSIRQKLREAGVRFKKSTKSRTFFCDLISLELKPQTERPLYIAVLCGGGQEYAAFFCGKPSREHLMRWFRWLLKEILKPGKICLFIDSDPEHEDLKADLMAEFKQLDVVKLPPGTTRVMMADHAGALHKLLNLCVLGRFVTHLDHILLWIRRMVKWAAEAPGGSSHLEAFWPKLVELMDDAPRAPVPRGLPLV